ncbi:Putative RNA methylase family UPF0020 [Limimonas halophila]|uniref:Putative RNA methylase family UPF0020 n=1 Tax=Limimonas halophila TaxID=1082479 RepID=A0A1G7PAA8_9PROT|nr:methyltransferase domain-containing protein [Limimonas halophila]SDF83151.1 Putative RNA methylase family UPF0020 [Limimonas halophila]
MTRPRTRSRSSKGEAPAQSPDALLLRCAPGLARVLRAEGRYTGVLPPKARVDFLWQRNHDLLFLPKPPRFPRADELRVAEEVHRVLAFGRYKVSAHQLDQLAQGLKRRGKRWRIAVSVDGKQFNRFDMGRWLSKELGRRGLRIDESAGATVFVFCVEAAYYICVREREAAAVRGRDKRRAEREGSLPPTIAAALAFQGKPKDRDVILDPVCGSGTLLAEAGAYAPEAELYGMDTDRRAVKTARRNLAHLANTSVEPGDARELDLPDGAVTLTLANLPFGKQFGDADGTPALYRGVLAEIARTAAAKGWRGVILAGDGEILSEAAEAAGLAISRQFTVRVRGEPASMALLERAS